MENPTNWQEYLAWRADRLSEIPPKTYEYTKADIDELEDDCMRMRDALKDVLGWIECSSSRSALESIVKRGLGE